MKFRYFLTIALSLGVISTVPVFGQKLSADAEALLARRDLGLGATHGLRAPKAVEYVKAFIRIADDSAIDAVRNLGITVHHNFDGILTATVGVDQLRELAALEGVEYVQMGAEVNLLMESARHSGHVDEIHSNEDNQLPRAYTGSGIVIGVIDNGFEYNHPAFYTSDGKESRIKAVWDQNATGRSPEAYGYGAEYTSAQEFISARYDMKDTYHGTHTTSIAAGGDLRAKNYGVATDADIVLVSFGPTNVDIANGISYIFDYADKVGKPCVINMSLGSHQGPHDGNSFLDKVIDSKTGEGRIIVGACGNEGQFNIHASKTFTGDDTTLKTMLTPASQTSYPSRQVVEIWGSKGSNIKVKAIVADALRGRIVYSSDWYDTSNPSQKAVAKYIYIDENGADAAIVISGATEPEEGYPSVYVDISDIQTGSGRKLGLVVEGEDGATVHLWNLTGNVFYSNNFTGWTEGDNSYTVGEIGGTAKSIIAVGAYDNRDRVEFIDETYVPVTGINLLHRSYFSSMGPTVDGRVVPHVLAAGTPVIAAFNKYASYNDPSFYATEKVSGFSDPENSYYYQYDIGTSMAAPFVAGTIALWLEACPDLTPDKVKETIACSSSTNRFMDTLPNNEYGYGRINALEGMKVLLGLSTETVDATVDSPFKVWADRASKTVYVVGAEGVATVKVFDITGRPVADIAVEDGVATSVDASAWGNGVFIVSPCGGNTADTQRILL